jgi:hypothetical protein
MNYSNILNAKVIQQYTNQLQKLKHGKHDQSTHGRRGSGSGSGGASVGGPGGRAEQGGEYGGYKLNTPDNPVDNGKYSPEARALAKSVRDRMAAIEPEISADLIDFGNKHGMEMSGLDYRMKAEKSIARKIDAEAESAGISREQAAASMSDIIRYTMLAPTDGYVDSVNSVVADMQAKGYQTRIKNYWESGDPYQGINVAVIGPDGTAFELQFHTPESHDAKEPIHKDYEVYRESKNNLERWNSYGRMVRMAQDIPVPPPPNRLLGIGQTRFQGFTTASGQRIDYNPNVVPFAQLAGQ